MGKKFEKSKRLVKLKKKKVIDANFRIILHNNWYMHKN